MKTKLAHHHFVRPIPNPIADHARDEALHSLMDGRARHKAPPDTSRRSDYVDLTIRGKRYKYIPAPITLPKLIGSQLAEALS